jgi:WhiB family redox-sensing transcriptional regulator
MSDDWREDAACLSLPTEWFYIEHATRPLPVVSDACGSCPVSTECLDHALHFEAFGFWAGTSERERRRLRRLRGIRLEQPKAMRAPMGCGTDAGFQAHHRRGEVPCEGCLHAHSARKSRYPTSRVSA